VAVCRPAPLDQFHVDNVSVAVVVRETGAAEVHETQTVTFTNASVPSFERVVALDYADRASFVSAAVDGRAIAVDAASGDRISVHGDAPLRVVWTLAPGPRTTHVFELRYVAEGAVALQGARGRMALGVIPARRPTAVDLVTVSFMLADGLHLFDGSGVAEAGWTLERTPNGIAGTKRGLAPAEGVTLIAQTSADPAVLRQPQWQKDADWAEQFSAAFVAGGAFILVVGIGILIIIRLRYPRRGSARAAHEPNDERPGDRDVVRRGLWIGGWVSVALAVACAAVVQWTLPHGGPWPQAVPVSILLVGLLFAAVSRRFV
jgi:hypothetical protein